jgi:hypothetical protein
MIAHVILFQPRPGLTESDRLQIFEAFTAAAAAAPAVLKVRIGRRVRHGLPGYEADMRQDFEYLAILEFDSVDALKAYLQHPAHAEAGRHFSESAEASLAYDYHMVEADNRSVLLA